MLKAGVFVNINVRGLFLLALSLLIGCEDEQQKSLTQNPIAIAQKFVPELYALPLIPIAPEVVVPKVVASINTPVEFGRQSI